MRSIFLLKILFVLMISCSSSFGLHEDNIFQDQNNIRDTCFTIQREGDFNLYECYYASGKLKSRTYLRRDQRWGSMEEYYENGRLSLIGQAYYDVRQGDFYYFDSAGAISKIAHYRVFDGLNPKSESTRIVETSFDSLSGESVERGTSYPSEEKLESIEFYGQCGLIDSIQFWSGDTIFHTDRQKK